MKLRTEAPVNGGRNYNGPKVRFASLSKIWLFAGKSEYPTLRGGVSRVKMRWVQTISRKGQQEQIWRAKREVCGRARLQSCHQGGKIGGGLAPEVLLLSCWNPQRLYARFQLRLEKI